MAAGGDGRRGEGGRGAVSRENEQKAEHWVREIKRKEHIVGNSMPLFCIPPSPILDAQSFLESKLSPVLLSSTALIACGGSYVNSNNTGQVMVIYIYKVHILS